MSKPDRNFLSFAGERPLGVKIVGDLVPPDDGKPWSDVLKLSNSANGSVRAGHVVGGAEDCVDVNNHCAFLTIEAALWEPRGDYLATIKGGSRNITLRGTVRGHGKVVDVDLGNVSDQSDDVTGPIELDLVHEGGEPITVRMLNAVTPKFANGARQRYVISFQIPGFWRSLFSKAYKLLKRLGVPI